MDKLKKFALLHGVFLPSSITRLLPPVNFLTIHYFYFILTTLIFSVVFWASSPQPRKISYIDSLFMTASAMTETGLHTLNLSSFNTFQQVLLFVLAVIGNPLFISWIVVLFRKRGFEKKFKEVVEAQTRREIVEAIQLQDLIPGFNTLGYHSTLLQDRNQNQDSSTNDARSIIPVRRFILSTSTIEGVDRPQDNQTAYVAPEYLGHRTQASSVYSQNEFGVRLSNQPAQETRSTSTVQMPQFSSLNPPLVGHVHDLTREGRFHLGGVEYRALRLFAWVIPLYLAAWQIIGSLCIASYITLNKSRVALRNGVDPSWTGIFLTVSAFNNMGMSLLDQSMVSLNTNSYLIIMLLPLMLAGNIAYPLFLRFTISAGRFLFPSNTKTRPTLQFMLDHPRRVYTHLFPSTYSIYLLLTICVLTAVDWIAFELLNRRNELLLALPIPARIFSGVFQAIANRSSGFQLIAFKDLAPGYQVLALAMMYTSIYPVTMALRSSNIYEDRALGISSPPLARPPTPRLKNLRQQIRLQLSHDLWWIMLCMFIIVIIESSFGRTDPLFNYLFEIISAYGPVGLSLGLPNHEYSFSGSWTTGSKLILIAVMLRGRHRSLPVVIDGAVMLPEEDEDKDEDSDANADARGGVRGDF